MGRWGRGWVMAAALASCGGRTVVVVDRIEDETAVLVDDRGEQRWVPVASLPRGSSEGTVLVDGVPDQAERRRLLEEQQLRRARLLRDDGQDFSLGGSAP